MIRVFGLTILSGRDRQLELNALRAAQNLQQTIHLYGENNEVPAPIMDAWRPLNEAIPWLPEEDLKEIG